MFIQHIPELCHTKREKKGRGSFKDMTGITNLEETDKIYLSGWDRLLFLKKKPKHPAQASKAGSWWGWDRLLAMLKMGKLI